MATERSGGSDGQFATSRRAVLGSALLGGAVLGWASLAGAAGPGRGGGFPPAGITEYGRAVDLGGGQVRPFTTETPSGEPKYHGVVFDRDALDPSALPSGEDLAGADNRAEPDKYRAGGQATVVHYKWTQQYFVPFPDAAATPFTFLGLNWNPGGHFGGAGAWLRPHFDVHFHMLDPARIDAVEGPQLPPYDTGNGEYTGGSPAPDPGGRVTATNFDYDQLPAGYLRAPDPVADQRYVTDMGEHAAPADAPELPDAPGERGDPTAFTNTLIQGFIGVGPGGAAGSRLAFVEPMVTREYLAGVSGVERYEVPQPDEYPHDLHHPTGYSLRDLPSRDAVAVVLEGFEPV
jgi:hypothetical protein